MEFKGTKGKWVLNNHVIESYLGNDIAEVWDSNDEENQANALLISKAPEMLELLQSLVSSEMTPLAIRKQAKQLIKEATEL